MKANLPLQRLSLERRLGSYLPIVQFTLHALDHNFGGPSSRHCLLPSKRIE